MPQLENALSDSCAEVRLVAIEAIWRLITSERGIRVAAGVREPALRIVPRLAHLASDTDPNVAGLAICILTRIGEPAEAATPALMLALIDCRYFGGHTPMAVNVSAARALGAIKVASAAPNSGKLRARRFGSP